MAVRKTKKFDSDAVASWQRYRTQGAKKKNKIWNSLKRVGEKNRGHIEKIVRAVAANASIE